MKVHPHAREPRVARSLGSDKRTRRVWCTP
jgi:hypothetical protein